MPKEKKIIINELKNSGLVLEDPHPEDYHSKLFTVGDAKNIGTISPLAQLPILFPDGKGWKQTLLNLGDPEQQFNPIFDTYSCVVFGILKAMRLYLFQVYGIRATMSEMYNAWFADVKPNRGTTIRNGMESVRKHGWIEDAKYPFTSITTIYEYFRKPPKPIIIEAEGKLTKWDFHWEVLPTDLKAIAEQYKRTPVVLTGFAWASYYGTGVYYDYNNPANHCFVGLELNDKGNNICADTYPKDFKYIEQSELQVGDLIKELDKSFNYGSAHCCWLTPKEDVSLLIKIVNMLKKVARDVHGGLWFLKDGKKQKIEDWLALAGALVDELGIDPKNNNLTDEQLSLLPDYKFFGK